MTDEEILSEKMQEFKVPQDVQRALVQSVRDGIFHMEIKNSRIRLRMNSSTYGFAPGGIVRIEE